MSAVPDQTRSVDAIQRGDESEGEAIARAMAEPHFRNAHIIKRYAESVLDNEAKPCMSDYATTLTTHAKDAAEGKLGAVSEALLVQAMSLDAIFTDLARRASYNLGQYPEAGERYLRLALKAQSNCRATLEALAKIHQPREQIVKHIHVNEGGQAVVADHFHHHPRGQESKKDDEQAHAQGSCGAALPSSDAGGIVVPIPSHQRSKTVPHARRQKSRRPRG